MSNYDLAEDFLHFYNQLSDSGLTWGDYAEQLTFLIYLKIEYEYTQKPYEKKSKISSTYDWSKLITKSGTDLETHYQKTLGYLGKQSGLIGKIFRKGQNNFKTPASLERLINKINSQHWLGLDIKQKGTLFESVLIKHAQTMKTDSAEFPTPRVLVRAIIDVLKPNPEQTIYDPACGTGGFFIVAHDHIINNFTLDRDEKARLKQESFRGMDISDRQVRFCLMNLMMHGVTDEEKTIISDDSLAKENPDHFDFVLVDPPFGKKGSISKSQKEVYERQDFWVTTSDKHLNFLQHVYSLLKINGKAAIIVPDNVLFAKGSGETVRKKLMESCDLHTILRLPTGILHKPNSKANVLFFDRKKARSDGNAWTSKIWIYDMRTNSNFTPKENPIRDSDFTDFIKCFNSKNLLARKQSKRFHAFDIKQILKRDKTSLDIEPWIKDKSLIEYERLPPPKKIAASILNELDTATKSMKKLLQKLD